MMREKMKNMSFKQKIDYLWTYYKIWLLVPLIVGVIINVAYSAYRAGQENILVSAVVIGAGSWGTALALLLYKNGHRVTVWSYK